MRNSLRFTAAIVGLSLALAGCASEEKPAEPSETADTGITAEVTEDGFPVVTGDFGEVPTISAGVGDPPTELKVKVLQPGDGPEVTKDSTLKVNYAGQLWDGNKFDSSFDRGAPAVFSLSGVIEGWTEGLAGTHVGDRVLLVIPPELGYKDRSDNESIPPNSTLVFVVDVIDRVNFDQLKEAKETGSALPEGITIGGALGEKPLVEVSDKYKATAEQQVIIIAQGPGSAINVGDSVLMHQTIVESAQASESSWDIPKAPTPEVIEEQGAAILAGVTEGSRVLICPPANEGQSIVIVLDVGGVIPN